MEEHEIRATLARHEKMLMKFNGQLAAFAAGIKGLISVHENHERAIAAIETEIEACTAQLLAQSLPEEFLAGLDSGRRLVLSVFQNPPAIPQKPDPRDSHAEPI